MTRKATLSAWAESLGAISAADADKMTAAQLEQAIEQAIDRAANPAPEPEYRLGKILYANGQSIRENLPGAIRAVASNLLS